MAKGLCPLVQNKESCITKPRVGDLNAGRLAAAVLMPGRCLAVGVQFSQQLSGDKSEINGVC